MNNRTRTLRGLALAAALAIAAASPVAAQASTKPSMKHHHAMKHHAMKHHAMKHS